MWVRDKIPHRHMDSPICPPCNHRMNHGAQICAAFGKNGLLLQSHQGRCWPAVWLLPWSPQRWRWRCHLPTVLALTGVCREPVPSWVCLVAPREGVLRSLCHCDGGTQHRGYNPAPLSASGVFSAPRLHRTWCGVQHGSSAATFCPQPLVGMGTWGQWARGDNGSTGTMGAWGQREHRDRLRPRRCCDTAQ